MNVGLSCVLWSVAMSRSSGVFGMKRCLMEMVVMTGSFVCACWITSWPREIGIRVGNRKDVILELILIFSGATVSCSANNEPPIPPDFLFLLAMKLFPYLGEKSTKANLDSYLDFLLALMLDYQTSEYMADIADIVILFKKQLLLRREDGAKAVSERLFTKLKELRLMNDSNSLVAAIRDDEIDEDGFLREVQLNLILSLIASHCESSKESIDIDDPLIIVRLLDESRIFNYIIHAAETDSQSPSFPIMRNMMSLAFLISDECVEHFKTYGFGEEESETFMHFWHQSELAKTKISTMTKHGLFMHSWLENIRDRFMALCSVSDGLMNNSQKWNESMLSQGDEEQKNL